MYDGGNIYGNMVALEEGGAVVVNRGTTSQRLVAI